MRPAPHGRGRFTAKVQKFQGLLATFNSSETSARRNVRYLRTYGISLADYERMYEEQAGCCYLCRTPADKGHNGALVVDHSHQSGEARRLLCHRCNRGLGNFQDDPSLLELAAAYLRRYQKES